MKGILGSLPTAWGLIWKNLFKLLFFCRQLLKTYSNSVWKVCSVLQEFFGCFTGANTYLTPPSTQGFAPHYDDVEVFMLQVEGRKRWRVYPPFENDELPRTSSRNYHPKEVTQKEEIYEILNPGDVLYVPRGWIHQGFYLTKFLVF